MPDIYSCLIFFLFLFTSGDLNELFMRAYEAGVLTISHMVFCVGSLNLPFSRISTGLNLVRLEFGADVRLIDLKTVNHCK